LTSLRADVLRSFVTRIEFSIAWNKEGEKYKQSKASEVTLFSRGFTTAYREFESLFEKQRQMLHRRLRNPIKYDEIEFINKVRAEQRAK